MRKYRNRFERIYRVRPPRGFYSKMAKQLNIFYTSIRNNFWKEQKPKPERICKIMMFIDQELGIAVRPELLWGDENNFPEEQKVYIDYETFRKDVMGWMKKNRGKETCSIIEKYLNGEILESISLKVGRSRERIRQIILREAEFLRTELKLENYRV